MNNFKDFANAVCLRCKSNDWFCPSLCDFLEKAKNYPFERIKKTYDKYDGDIYKVEKAIRRWK